MPKDKQYYIEKIKHYAGMVLVALLMDVFIAICLALS